MGKRFAAAWRFLTIFPLPLSRPGPDEAEHLRASPGLFPAVGLALGLLMAGLAALLGLFLPRTAVAALMVATLAYPSGALHLDGLADSADGLLSPGRDREKALAVMKDSRIGAHGAVALIIILLLKYACLVALSPDDLPFVMLAVPLAGRASMLFPMALLPYAREKGLGGLFAITDVKSVLAGACVWTGGAMAALWGVGQGLAGLGVWGAATMGWVAFLKRRLGGATGDSYGATCEIAETAVCLAAAALFGYV